VREYKANDRVYKARVQTVMRRSYGDYYRRMVPILLQVLRFRSNTAVHRPVIRALRLFTAYAESHVHHYAPGEDVPIEGVVPRGLQDLVVERDKDGNPRVNRITYEIYALQALREGLRSREIWVEGANRFRNPDEDLPADFEDARDTYYDTLRQPRDAEAFIAALQEAMQRGLDTLHAGLRTNKGVRILTKKGGWIAVSPLDPVPAPPNLARLKAEVTRLWPMTDLLDFLKEADLQIGFTDVFRSAPRARRSTTTPCSGACCCASMDWARTPASSASPPASIRRDTATCSMCGAGSSPKIRCGRLSPEWSMPLSASAWPPSGARARPPAPRTPRSSAPGTRI
jgi:hypothetical protein